MRSLSLIISLVSFSQALLGQDAEQLSLPPLDSIISKAIAHSPALKAEAAQVERGRHGFALAGKDWSNRVFTDMGYFYASDLSNQTVASTSGGFESISLQQGDVWRAGVSVRVSLFDLFARGNLKQKAYQEWQFNQHRQEQLTQDLATQIEQIYLKLVLAQKMVAIKSDNLQSMLAFKEMAEKEFVAGEIPIAELSRVSELATRAQEHYQQARTEFEMNYAWLERLAGVKLITL